LEIILNETLSLDAKFITLLLTRQPITFSPRA
jgi:hypothetical protein